MVRSIIYLYISRDTTTYYYQKLAFFMKGILDFFR